MENATKDAVAQKRREGNARTRMRRLFSDDRCLKNGEAVTEVPKRQAWLT
jgi:hypothetical protein